MKNTNRFKLLPIIVGAGFLAGIFGSLELWFPVERNFPRAPLFFELPEKTIVAVERSLTAALVISLVSLILWRRKVFFTVAAGLLALLFIFDQTRLQPWVYQYWLLIVLLALREPPTEDDETSDQTRGLVQILIAALYFWSGVQKLNFSFVYETLPLLLAPLQSIFPFVRPPFVFPGIAIALVEIFTGCGLLFRRTRRVAVCLAVIMHLTILVLLMTKNYNHIVWIWNAALIALVVVAFRKSDASFGQKFKKAKDYKTTLQRVIVAASVFLPALSFFGLWDMYLSGALYSGNVEIAVIRIDANLLEKLPPAARQVVIQTKSGEQMLPLLEWASAEMNVPVYPEKRVFRQIAAKVCQSAAGKNHVELIIKERPAILDGSYRLTRINCSAIEKR